MWQYTNSEHSITSEFRSELHRFTLTIKLLQEKKQAKNNSFVCFNLHMYNIALPEHGMNIQRQHTT